MSQRMYCTRTGLPSSCDISAASTIVVVLGLGLKVLAPSKISTRMLFTGTPVTSATELR